MNPNTIIYRRVSTDDQKDSIALQEKRCDEYCTINRDFKQMLTHPDLSYGDPDTSGRIHVRERPGGRACFNRLELADIRHLVIAKADRIARNTIDGLQILDWLKKRDIVLHIVDLGGDTITSKGHWGRVFLTQVFAMAEWEVEEICARTKTQMQDLFDTGKLTGNVPMGKDCRYTFQDGTTHLSNHALSRAELARLTGDDVWLKAEHSRLPKVLKELIDNPAEQRIIFQLKAWRDAGHALNKIADLANAAGYVTKLGKPWSTGAVDSVLHSRHTQLLLQQSILAKAA
jgi:DNA invertase Pin-like site-specific DNA recombinase